MNLSMVIIIIIASRYILVLRCLETFPNIFYFILMLRIGFSDENFIIFTSLLSVAEA